MRNIIQIHLKTLSVVAVLVALIGCKAGTAEIHSPRLTYSEAVEIAKKEAQRRGWTGSLVESVELDATHEIWSISLEGLPQTPGHHAFVEISAQDGDVIRWRPGL